MSNERVLLVSYAFPPMQLPMAPCAAKLAAGFKKRGCAVEVVCAAPFDDRIPWEASLLPYVRQHADVIHALRPPASERLPQLWRRSRGVEPDLMAQLDSAAEVALDALPLEDYAAVFTLAPFHSVNPVMTRLKRRRPKLRWVAQFSDPWSRNPLETSAARETWNREHEPQTVEAADHILHTSVIARDMMLSGMADRRHKTSIVSHAFDPCLYPRRPRNRAEHITIRHVGGFIPGRMPDSFLAALRLVVERRSAWRERVRVELVGVRPETLAATARAFDDIWPMVRLRRPVPYLESLDLMWDADILLLIEHDADVHPFVPSKLADYVGARRPVLSLSPFGGSQFELERLGLPWARPGDVPGIARALEALIEEVAEGRAEDRVAAEHRELMRNDRVAAVFLDAAHRLQ